MTRRLSARGGRAYLHAEDLVARLQDIHVRADDSGNIVWIKSPCCGAVPNDKSMMVQCPIPPNQAGRDSVSICRVQKHWRLYRTRRGELQCETPD